MIGKQDLIESALRLGKEEELKYVGCAQSTFSGICRTFREAGIPLMEREDEEKIFKGMIGLMAGCGCSAKGSCGGCTAASFCVSFVLNKSREDNHEDLLGTLGTVGGGVKEGVVNRFMEDYGSCVCRDIQFARFGKAIDFFGQNSQWLPEFLKNTETCEVCQGGNCTIAKAAAWGVAAICDIKGIK
jgi:hypothetical protein